MKELRTISVLVKNERGVLARVAGLLARRGFNITSLAVGETERPEFSRISVVVEANDATLEQMCKQLNRLVSVQRVSDLSQSPKVERGLALIKLRADAAARRQIVELAGIFRARVDHVDHDSLVVEATGGRDKLQAMIDMLSPFGIVEMARTGQIVLGRDSVLDQEEELSQTAGLPAMEAGEEEAAAYNLTQQN